MTDKKEITKQDILQDIRKNYKELEHSIVSQLLLETPNHHPTTGTYREQVWQSLFRQIIPHKFSIAQGVFIIDSSEDSGISQEVDLAVYDEQYTPYIFNYGNIKFIPIEAVAVVIQCKSTNLKSEKLENWVDSIDGLKTHNKSISRFATGLQISSPPSQSATRPIKILCALENWIDSENQPKNNFDICIYTEKEGDKRLNINYSKKIDRLASAYKELNHKDSSDCDIDKTNKDKLQEKDLRGLEIKDFPILSLTFQLNQLLMLINNPMLFPHQAYAEMFNNAKP